MAESRIVVFGALAGNVAIAVTKFIVAGVTGSAAMMAEGIHSTVDTGNSILLLVGLRRSQRKPDEEHPFGYGKELYFWSLIVAVLIFGVGGGVSAYEGVMHIANPRPIEEPFWNYVVLAFAALFDGTSFVIAVRAIITQKNEAKGDKGFWQSLRESKDPATFTVFAEDGAALIGLTIAALGIFLGHTLDLPVLDGVASLLIGVLLAAVAMLLIFKSRSLLVGTGVDKEMVADIRKLIVQDEAVDKVAMPLTMYFGPDSILLVIDVNFHGEVDGPELAAAVRRIEQTIRDHYPTVKRIYIEAVRN